MVETALYLSTPGPRSGGGEERLGRLTGTWATEGGQQQQPQQQV